jgi:hypothetical protein
MPVGHGAITVLVLDALAAELTATLVSVKVSAASAGLGATSIAAVTVAAASSLVPRMGFS